MTRVAVVGAGIAGLAAARRLAEAGLEPSVFEKARAPGGRLATRREGELAFDHGAQYFTCREPDFEAVASDWIERGVVALWQAPIVVLEAGRVGESRGARATRRFVGVPGMSAVSRDLSRGLALRCGVRMTKLVGRPRDWALRSEAGEVVGDFSAVLVATPAPQGAPLVAPARRLARRVAAVEMQACHAALLGFSQPLDVELGGAFVEASPLAWIARNNSKPGRSARECWVLHTTPEWSAAHLEDPAEQVSTQLRRAFGEALGRSLPEPQFARVHRWRFARTARPLEAPFGWDPEAAIGVCGDWTFGGRVESAFRSGDLLAREVAASLGRAAGAV